MRPDLSVEIAGIRLQNPVMNAAGTLDLEPEGVRELVQVQRIGAFVQKSITLHPRPGNPQPRICEVTAGMINRIGLENVGVREFVEKKLANISETLLGVPLIVSVAGERINDYLETAVILEQESGGRIVALEINVSCPNVERGLVFGCDSALLFDLVAALKSKIALPLIIKLTPNVTDISIMAKAAVAGGADALSLINTVGGRAHISHGLHPGRWIEGGLSGPCIKPIALKKVDEAVRAVSVPVIGMGGISNTEDALDFFRAGVTAIAVGTSTFLNPLTMVEIIDGLEKYLAEKGYSSIKELKEKESGGGGRRC